LDAWPFDTGLGDLALIDVSDALPMMDDLLMWYSVRLL
jgi:hypothetical protein